jgi:hypothetical protein
MSARSRYFVEGLISGHLCLHLISCQRLSLVQGESESPGPEMRLATHVRGFVAASKRGSFRGRPMGVH